MVVDGVQVVPFVNNVLQSLYHMVVSHNDIYQLTAVFTSKSIS